MYGFFQLNLRKTINIFYDFFLNFNELKIKFLKKDNKNEVKENRGDNSPKINYIN